MSADKLAALTGWLVGLHHRRCFGYLVVWLNCAAECEFKIQMALLIALMVISSFDSVANANNWTIEGELNFYNAYYKDEPGLTGTVVSNISDAIDENTYKNFSQALQNLDFVKFKKVYIYYEVDGHNAYYFFMALGANGDSCQSFYTSKLSKGSSCISNNTFGKFDIFCIIKSLAATFLSSLVDNGVEIKVS
ncbi:MAG: hypothetical protein HRT35_24505 [Algicola sp.]|nr:hypothetical protein [Algicola sp.]